MIVPAVATVKSRFRSLYLILMPRASVEDLSAGPKTGSVIDAPHVIHPIQIMACSVRKADSLV